MSVLVLGVAGSAFVLPACGSSSERPGIGAGGFGAGGGGGGVGGGINTTPGQDGGLPSGCATDTYGGEALPLDLYIMLDRSGSMSDAGGGTSSVWDAVTGAIRDFVNSPDSSGIGVGLQFFPPDTGMILPNCGVPPACLPGCVPFGPVFCIPLGGGSCDLNDYLPPAVNIQPLPGVAPDIVAAMGATTPGGGTPTLPAMESAIQATTALRMQNPGRKVVIVLATDGNPNDCNSSIQSVSNAAAMGLPDVQTFVIGIGNIAGLDQIAQAGGTMSALQVNTATAGQDFLDALNVIRGSISCSLSIPVPAGQQTGDPNQINIGFTPEGMPQEIIPGVGTGNDCQGQTGWYFDDAKTQINLCPATCDRATNVLGTLDVVLGCSTVVR